MAYDPLKLEEKHRQNLTAKQRYDLWKLSAEQKRQKNLSGAIDTLKILFASEFSASQKVESPKKESVAQGVFGLFSKKQGMSQTEDGASDYFVDPFEIGKRLAYYLDLDKQSDAAWRVYGDLQSRFAGDWYYQEKISSARAKMLKKEKRFDHAALHFSLSQVYDAWNLMQRIEGVEKTTEYLNKSMSEAGKRIFSASKPEDDCMWEKWNNDLSEFRDEGVFEKCFAKFLGKKSPPELSIITECVMAIVRNPTPIAEDIAYKSIESTIKQTSLWQEKETKSR